MNYYISDLHLFHDNSIKFDKRPFANLESMHSTIVSNWNARVTNGDSVYILGDMSMRGRNEDLIALVAILKGKKILVKGNHDDVSDYRYSRLFAEICDYNEIHDSIGGRNVNLVLSHYPIFSWKDMGRGTVLLYGHTHDSDEDRYYQKCIAGMYSNECRHVKEETGAPRTYNVGCMKPWMNYSPRTLKEIFDYNDTIDCADTPD